MPAPTQRHDTTPQQQFKELSANLIAQVRFRCVDDVIASSAGTIIITLQTQKLIYNQNKTFFIYKKHLIMKIFRKTTINTSHMQ